MQATQATASSLQQMKRNHERGCSERGVKSTRKATVKKKLKRLAKGKASTEKNVCRKFSSSGGYADESSSGFKCV